MRYHVRTWLWSLLGLLVSVTQGGYSPSHGQETAESAPPVEQVVTRAWAHDEFGRLVFDWPSPVAYGARIEGKTLTVMFDRYLHTTFRQVPRYLGAYISAVDLGPDGQSVVASLTDEYRLRTFLLNSGDAGVKVVVDLLADEGTDPRLAAVSPPEASAESAPGDSPLSPAAAESAPTPSLPFAVETAPEDAQSGETEAATEETPPVEADATSEGRSPASPGRGEANQPPPAPPLVDAAAAVPPAPPDSPPEAAPTAEDSVTPPERGAEDTPAPAPPPVDAAAAAPPTEPTPETAAEATPPAATAAKETPPVQVDPTPEALTPEPPIPTLPASVQIPVSQSRLFRLDTPVASVFVANPDIADVQLVSSGVLFVVGKAVGRTSVAALDAESELIGEWTIATVLDIQPARAALAGVPRLESVAVRQLNKGVELSGTVASIAAADLALRLTTTALPAETPVENRISVTGMQQVNLEVQIAEVQRNVSETLGFNWEVLPDIGGGRDIGFRVGRFFFDEDLQKYIVNSLPGGEAAALSGSTGFGPGRTTVRGLIDALATAGLATVLARPNVTAVSGETASFFSGGEYPLPAGFEDGAIIFEYKRYGVLLDFVPTIIDAGRIMLTVRPEVSQRSETESLRATGIDIPVINVRRAETTVEVGNGESIVIAGLYRDQSETVESGVPVAKDIPLLGLLFGTKAVRSNATELIVIVTARLTSAAPMPRTTDRDRPTPGRRIRGYYY